MKNIEYNYKIYIIIKYLIFITYLYIKVIYYKYHNYIIIT